MGFLSKFLRGKSTPRERDLPADVGDVVMPTSDSAIADATAFIDAGIASARSKDYFAALRAFDAAINIDPNSVAAANAYTERGKVKSVLKDHVGAERDRQQACIIIERLDVAIEAYQTGMAKYNNDDYVGAIAALDKAIAHGINLGEVYHLRGLARKLTAEFVGAIQDFTKAVEIDPRHTAAYYQRGLIKFHVLNDNHGAIEDFDKAISIDPSHVDAYRRRAELKNEAEAVLDLGKAIALAPRDASLYFARGLKKYDMEDYDGTIQDLNTFIRLAPTDGRPSVSDGYCVRALIRFLLHDYEAAMMDYSKVIELDPSNANAYHSRGLCRLELGSEVEGRRDLIEAINLGYQEDD
jgi:tetratricopeptide (TPR) repeat protein